MMEEFVNKLVALCREHNAVLYARIDGKYEFVSIEIGNEEWTDYKLISSNGALKHERDA